MRSSATRSLILALLALALCAAAAAYVILEQEQNGRLIREGVVSLRTWDDLQARAPRAGEEGTDAASARLQELVLASESDTVGFLAFVDDLARQSGVSIAATGLKVTRTSEPGFDDLSASFLVRGDTAAVEKVIELFELLPYRSRIESLSLSRADGAADANLTVLVSVRE